MGQDCDSYFFWYLCGQTLEEYKSRKLHRTTSRKHHRCSPKVKTRLDSQRGWDGFVEFFHVEDLEGGIRNVLLAFASVAGVGAGLAYLIR